MSMPNGLFMYSQRSSEAADGLAAAAGAAMDTNKQTKARISKTVDMPNLLLNIRIFSKKRRFPLFAGPRAGRPGG
jgi:hypothetical protein